MSAATVTHDVVVVGGGIAGLTAAWRLRDRDVVLLESEERVGGRIKSVVRDGYPMSVGAHMFPGPESTVGRLLTELQLDTMAIRGSLNAFAYGDQIIDRGRVEAYPLRLRMSMAGRASFLRAAAKIRLGVLDYQRKSRRRPGEDPIAHRRRLMEIRQDESFSDFLGPLHPDAEQIFRTVSNRATAEPEEITAGAALWLFAVLWTKGEGLGRNLAGGAGAFPAAIADALGPQRVRVGARVTAVTPAPDHVDVAFSDADGDQTLRARHVVVATPAYVTAQIVADLPPAVAHALAQIQYGPYVVASFLTDEQGPQPWDDTYAMLAVGRSFTMMFNHAHVLRAGQTPRAPGGSIMVYAGAGRARRLLDAPDDEVIATYTKDLFELYPSLDGHIKDVIVQRWPQAIPFARPGWGAVQRQLVDPPHERVHLAGDYINESVTMDVAAEGGERAAGAIRRRLGTEAQAG